MFFRSAFEKITISELKDEIASLRRSLNNQEQLVREYENRLNGEMASASFAIDWDVMKVFSVERNPSEHVPRTILGYMLSEPAVHTEGENGEQRVTYKDIVREWYLYCSAETHEKLVKEFTDWKNKK
jgi:hypothetical protein